MDKDSEEQMDLDQAVRQVKEANDALIEASLRRLAKSLREMPFICWAHIAIHQSGERAAVPYCAAQIDAAVFGGFADARIPLEFLNFNAPSAREKPGELASIAERLEVPLNRIMDIYEDLNASLAPLGRAFVAGYLGQVDGAQDLEAWNKRWDRGRAGPSAAGIARSWGWDALAAKIEAREIECAMKSGPQPFARAKPKL